MGVEDKYLNQFKAGKKEQYAARCAFFLAGFTVTTWAPMIPVIKERLQIGDDVLGLLLLCIGISAFVFMPLAGILNQKLGCKKMLQINIVLFALILIIISSLDNVWSFVVFLLLFGAVMGTIDVTMNMNSVIVEKLSKKRIMSSMHAFWSVGCFCSAGLFSVLAKQGLNITTVAIIHGIIIFVLCLISSPYFLAYKGASNEKPIAIPHGIVVLFGILACISFLAEGAIMDWSGIFLTEAKGLELSLAGIGYAIFSVAMLVIRFIGDRAVQYIGEERICVFGALVAGFGFLLVVLIDNFYLMPIGFICIGLGAANIVPVLYSLLKNQNDMPINAAVTAITCMGYTGVILGPALLGFIAHGIGIKFVFYLLCMLFIIEALLSKYIFKRLS
ncbi:MFS transporter [Megamonas hypermegale]|uniref:Inner membrane protein ybjJ n=1 Tax=Megamonas hypermegale TaxID=158847 RepID=A0A239U0R1_9FIRM|nr:MFS transporter [Megamonas hypermegale]MBM6761711.1 MFS transporter [Megamonas hypermegale]OUO39821.1 MFS transporter [Megamonas hypermegale]SNV02664.1 Inner membrane protein ybjJ [Megamonas hypermegale]